MDFKKSMLILVLAIFFISIAGVCASDANDTIVASEDANQIELSSGNQITEDNLQTTEENTTFAQTDNDESISVETDSQILSESEGTYYDLRDEIGNGGNKSLTKSYYSYTGGDAIEITTSGVINGNGAIIDMLGSNIQAFVVHVSDVTIKNLTIRNANCNGAGGAIRFASPASSGTVENCNFTNNSVTFDGGAVYFYRNGTVTNCNFTNNYATYQAGAIQFNSRGTVTNCNFTNNTAANGAGGAIKMDTGNVTNCNFTNNTASDGGAIWFDNKGNVENCNFANNHANDGGAIFSYQWYTTVDTCIFKTDPDSNFNIVNFPPTLNVDNFTSFYGLCDKLTFNLTTNSGMPVTNGNISISIYYKNNDTWVGNYSCLSGEGWTVDLPAGFYYAIYNTEYKNFEKINRTITINKANSSLNISDVTLDYGTSTYVTVTTEGATGITAKINDMDAVVKNNTIIIPILYLGTYTLTVTTIADGNHNNITKNALITVNKIKTELSADAINTSYNSNDDLVITLKDSKGTPLSNQLLFVDLNGVKMFMTDSNGQVKVLTHGLPANTYAARILFTGDDNYKKSNAEAKVTVNKDSTSLSADAITTTYNINKDLVVTLKDSNGKAINSVKVTVVLNGKTYTPTTDANGQVKLSTYGLTPKSYVATITFNGNNNYANSTTTVKVTVTKATPKLTAKAKTFKKSIKTKKYAVTLNDNNGKAMKKVKLTLKVKGKTYKARTNAKGKATFKIKKLTKKGKYEATIKYNGNKYYNKVTKKVKIVIK